jgi:chaperone modulatory protein CbpM
MEKHELMIIADYSQGTSLTLEELCEICHVPPHLIDELMAYEIIHPRQATYDQAFDLAELKRIQTALRLQHDFELNLSGVALALDLLDELKMLREEAALLKRHVKTTKL